ncbi:hypothetical protein C8J56DRAFT_1050903 [Mycena floridula]|nr:hypothetical protein C8J56DRAFT_1050903 [Mycena floridula]
MLGAHNLRGYTLRVSDVDETGKLVIARFMPGPTDHSAFDTHIWMAFETDTFIKEDLLAYYKFLFDMITWPTYLPTPTLLGPFDKAALFQLSHPEIKLPVYSLPGWNTLVFEVDGSDTTVDVTGIVLKLLPNMTIWYSIPDWKRATEPPGPDNLWATKHLYLFRPLKSACNIYWSQDEEGHQIINDSSIQAAFGITIDWNWCHPVHSIPPQFYPILCTIHETCGFDPHSTEVAEYLGLPVAVIDDGHSGLEEYVEDPEYTSESESESGDSDYVSASEDV